LEKCSASAKISAVCIARTYGLEKNALAVAPSAATPFATSFVFAIPSSVKYLSGSAGHFGSSRSIAIP